MPPQFRGRRGLLLCTALLAFGSGLLKIGGRPALAPFRGRGVLTQADEKPRFESRFLTAAQGTQSHAACLVELADGRIRAFWYAGSREGAPDVEIRTAVFSPDRDLWSAEQVAASPWSTGQSLERYVRKVGNPSAIRTPDGTLWLFYVTVSLGGWSTSSITEMRSHDEGETWEPARRLITSPFFNLGTLVRGAPILYEDGTIGLPVYHELLGRSAELLRIDPSGAVVDRRRLSAGEACRQPVLLVRSPTDALALMRNASVEQPRRVLVTRTGDAGQHWTTPTRTSLSNPDAAVSGAVLPDGRILVALNDLEIDRDALSLALSEDGGATWKTVRVLEDEVAERDQPAEDARYDRTVAALAQASDARVGDPRPWVESSRRNMCWGGRCHFEFSYPFLLQAGRGQFHLVYTWNRSFIKHVEFNLAWLDQWGHSPDAPH